MYSINARFALKKKTVQLEILLFLKLKILLFLNIDLYSYWILCIILKAFNINQGNYPYVLPSHIKCTEISTYIQKKKHVNLAPQWSQIQQQQEGSILFQLNEKKTGCRLWKVWVR